jgi:hypothetical protein
MRRLDTKKAAVCGFFLYAGVAFPARGAHHRGMATPSTNGGTMNRSERLLDLDKRISRTLLKRAQFLIYQGREQRAETARRNRVAGKRARKGLPPLETVLQEHFRVYLELIADDPAGKDPELHALMEERELLADEGVRDFEELLDELGIPEAPAVRTVTPFDPTRPVMRPMDA